MNHCLSFLCVILCCLPVWADEGMWMLQNLTPKDWNKMQSMGLTLSPEKLYNDSLPSLYNAVVHFNGGCTGITISNQGLIFTNHHCGYGAIQSQSSLEHDYLKDGFIAQTQAEEIPIPDMVVRYLEKSVSVTDIILDSIPENISAKEREALISQKIAQVEAQYRKTYENTFIVKVDAYYAGNEYYVNIYRQYSDIRMVFAPPSSVGKFGGETDNWMWPRHTGDFSVFRVYANTDNEPADYSENNVPYTPQYFAPISIKGYKEGSFAMVMGFPGSTNRYLSSWGIESRVKSSNEPRIEVRGVKQNIWKEAMLQSDAIRIKYAYKYAGSSNYWKNSIGMNRGLKRMHVLEKKQALEKQFADWVDQQPDNSTYTHALNLLSDGFTHSMETNKIRTYLSETFWAGTEIIDLASEVDRIHSQGVEYRETLFNDRILPFYKDYEPSLDKKVLAAMLQLVKNHIPAQQLPPEIAAIDKKYKGNFSKFAEELFKKSVFLSPDKLKNLLLNDKNFSKIEKDDAYKLYKSVRASYDALNNSTQADKDKIKQGNRLFIKGLREMNPTHHYPADANSTLRLTYGKVGGYQPYDGAWYDYFTTTNGISEKYDLTDPEFNVQAEIMHLFQQKEFGRYANEAGNMNLCYISNLDITGGNSGSPVFDGQGRLTGLAFDGNWESMSGDIAFEPEVQKCIAVDIRYVLFMIDKWGKCQRIMDEINIQ
ncbi:MAG: Dipeptidyl-peptidase 7 [Candidatus Ordinivivax streblomastigis]|uniref:Dipeptidyl-peptidase n=1 Tax=Candidatus Ordinivivax streblomastigis TaxID=2540710 RepID=A0A5M8NYY6_9BACT|nr:MAG: Dipeptidyl-peptidase 7 [Candidatus Ordinivivax streblomastigis]